MPNVQNIISDLHRVSNEKRKKMYEKLGIKEAIIGVNLGDLRKLAGKIKTNHSLAYELWATEIYEARVIASILFEAKQLDQSGIEKLILSTQSGALIDELSFQQFASLDNQLDLLDKWILDRDSRLKRAGWNMGIILNHDTKLSDETINQLLNFIELNLQSADDMIQFAMNRCLCEIGIKHDQFTNQCLLIGEKLGVYKDMKVSKGCTSAYAPIWIGVVRKKYKKD